MKVISVEFTIYEAHNLNVEDRELLDPLVVVRCCNKEYITKKKKKKYNAVNWEESHRWDRMVLSELEWNVSKIEFEIRNANTFWRNEIIGVVSFELKLIRNKKNHELYGIFPICHKNGTDTRGKIRLKVSVCEEKDYTTNNDLNKDLYDSMYSSKKEKGRHLENDEFYLDLTKVVIDDDMKNDNKRILLGENAPKSEPHRFYYLYVNIHKIEDIYININNKPSRDLYITCEFNGCFLKSSQGRNCTNYTFNECFKIPICTPILEDSIILKIWDQNYLSNDELLAVGVLSFIRLKNSSINPMWFNFYGFHKNEINLEEEQNNTTSRMNRSKALDDFNAFIEGNFYMGRICLSAYVERLNTFDKTHVALVQSCLTRQEPQSVPMTLLCDVYLVTGIWAENIYVQLCCGPHQKRTGIVSAGDKKSMKQKDGVKRKSVQHVLNKDNVEQSPFFKFDDFVNMGNFFNSVVEKQKLLENKGPNEFHFNSKNGKIENVKMCPPSDELQQWDVIINVYERRNHLNNYNYFGNLLQIGNRYNGKSLYEGVENTKLLKKQAQKNTRRNRLHPDVEYDVGKDDDRNELKEETEDSEVDQRIAYFRVPLKNILLHDENKSRCPIWIPLKNIRRNSPRLDGMCYNSMYNIFQNGSILVNLEKSYNMHLGLSRRKQLVPMEYELRCYIYACRNVVSNFPTSPNTFVHISCNGKMKITSLVLNSSNPVFLQCLKLNISILTDYSVGLPTIPLIVVTLYEFYNNTFYFIGRCYCNYDSYLHKNRKNCCSFVNKGANYNVVEQIKPRWVKMKGKRYVKAMYSKNIWQQYGYEQRVMNEDFYTKQKEFTKEGGNTSKENGIPNQQRENSFKYNNILKGDRVGDILLYFELVKAEDSTKVPIFPMITEIKKCSLTFCCMALENLILIKKPDFLKDLYSKSIEKIHITHPIIVLSITSYSSYGKKQNELFIKYQKSLKNDQRVQLKKWKNSFNQQSFEMFSVDKMEIDIPLDPIFDPILHVKVYNKKVKQKYFIGETYIPLVPYLPWVENLQQVLTYLQAYDDYSETLDFQIIDTVMNQYQNKNASLIVSAISFADAQSTIALKKEIAGNEKKRVGNEVDNVRILGSVNNESGENDEQLELWNQLPIFKNKQGKEQLGETPQNTIKNRNYFFNGPQWQNGIPTTNMMMTPFNPMTMTQYSPEVGHSKFLQTGYPMSNGMYGGMHETDNAWSTVYGKNQMVPITPFPQRTVHYIKDQQNVYKLFDDGIPEIVKITYNIKDYPYLKVLINSFLLNVYIPPRFILYVEGNKINTKRLLKNFKRSSVEGLLENYLDDILLPSIPLKKKYNTFFIDEESVETRVETADVSFGCFEKFPFLELEGGYIKCFAKLKYEKYMSENIPSGLKDVDNSKTLRSKFRGDNKIPRYLKVRVYVLRGIGICGVNKNKSANPYLKFSLGEKTSSLRNSFKKCDMNPEFCSLWESEAIFPENEILTISVYSAEENYNNETSDIYIGSTEIHLIDRWLSKEWRYMMKKNKIPIEYRPIYNSLEKEIGNDDNLKKGRNIYKNIIRNVYNNFNIWQNIVSFFFNFGDFIKGSDSDIDDNSPCNKQFLLQNNERENYGILELWVEIMSYEQAKKTPIHKMPSAKKTEVEIRIIIWRCAMLINEINDSKEKKAIDLIITCDLDCAKYEGKYPTTQSTDVHYNCKTGIAIFNWRVVYPKVSHPINTCFLQISAYNNNNIGKSDFLGEVNLELSRYIHKVSQTMDTIEVNAELKLRKKKYDDESETACKGSVQLTAQFLPQQKADSKPVGLGRNEPNRNPYLKAPDSGREWEDFISSIGFNDIYKPFRSQFKLFFISLLIMWLFILSFVYPALLM